MSGIYGMEEGEEMDRKGNISANLKKKEKKKSPKSSETMSCYDVFSPTL